MSTETNKVVVRRLNATMQEFFRTGNSAGFDELLAPNFVHHAPGIPSDREGLKQVLPAFRAAFPDLQITTEDVIAEGDMVVDRVTVRGTHGGDFMGMQPTDKQFTITELHVARVVGGVIVERWSEWDALGLMQQLGVVPPE